MSDNLTQLNLPKSLFILILAYLVCNAARGFASRLTRGLALAATAVCNGSLNILGFNSLNSFHNKTYAFIY